MKVLDRRRQIEVWLRELARPDGRLGFVRHLFNGHAPAPPPSHVYVRLAIQLELERQAGQPGKRILLTSPESEALIRDAGEEFACILAQELGQRVLLVEAGSGGGCAGPGLTELLLEGPAGLDRVVRATSHEHVFLLPAGSPDLAPRALAAARHAEVIASACSLYDCVILLAGPALTDPKSLVFAPLVDHTLLLALDARTYVSELDASLQALADRRAVGVGVVLAREGHVTHR